MGEDYLTSMFPEAEIPPPEPGARLFAIRGCGDGSRGHGCCTEPGVHLGYHAEGWGPVSLCGSGNASIGSYRHRIWVEVEETEINCRRCYERVKELTRE